MYCIFILKDTPTKPVRRPLPMLSLSLADLSLFLQRAPAQIISRGLSQNSGMVAKDSSPSCPVGEPGERLAKKTTLGGYFCSLTMKLACSIVRGFQSSYPSSMMGVRTTKCSPLCRIGMVHIVQPQLLQNTLCFSCPLSVSFNTYVFSKSRPSFTSNWSLLNLAHY